MTAKEQLKEVREQRAKELQDVSDRLNQLLSENDAELKATRIEVEGKAPQFRIELRDKLGLI